MPAFNIILLILIVFDTNFQVGAHIVLFPITEIIKVLPAIRYWAVVRILGLMLSCMASKSIPPGVPLTAIFAFIWSMVIDDLLYSCM